jgi:hypothetical protein
MNETASYSVERRKYYRINDVVLLRYEVVSDDPAGEPAQGDTGGLRSAPVRCSRKSIVS